MKPLRVAVSLFVVAIGSIVACGAPSSKPAAAVGASSAATVSSATSTSTSASATFVESAPATPSWVGTVTPHGSWTDVYGTQSYGVPSTPPGPPMTIAIGTATTGNGQVPANVIERDVRAQLSHLRACYAHALGKNGALGGRITVAFVIDVDGSVKMAQVDGTRTSVADAELEKCVVGTIQATPFPVPVGGIVIVLLPIDFTSP